MSDNDNEPGRELALFEKKYLPEMDAVARSFAEGGATNKQIAARLDIAESTLYLWMHEYPSFREAIAVGKEPANVRVVRALYERATGYYVTEKQAIKLRDARGNETVEIVEIERFIPPDTTAQIYWTKNRDPENWKDRREAHHTGAVEVNHNDPDAARATIARYLERERQRQEGNDTLQ